MDCKQWNEVWVAYLYDECSAEERDAIEAHLSECDACREQMDSLSVTRRTLGSTASEIAAPPRVIVLPAAPPRTASAWSFARGFAAAAAVFAIGIFFGMTYFSSERVVIANDGAVDLSDPVATSRFGPTSEIRQIRNDYRTLDDRLGRIESSWPESQDDTLPTLATMERVQMAVGNLHQQFDRSRAQDLQFVFEWILTTDQESRLRDARTLQVLGVVHAENNPNVRQR